MSAHKLVSPSNGRTNNVSTEKVECLACVFQIFGRRCPTDYIDCEGVHTNWKFSYNRFYPRTCAKYLGENTGSRYAASL
jgi:hypothetical protein